MEILEVDDFQQSGTRESRVETSASLRPARASGTTTRGIRVSRRHIVNSIVCEYRSVWRDFRLTTGPAGFAKGDPQNAEFKRAIDESVQIYRLRQRYQTRNSLDSGTASRYCVENEILCT